MPRIVERGEGQDAGLQASRSKGQEKYDTLRHVQARSLDNKFAATLAKIKAKTIDCTVRDMQAKALVHRKTDTLLAARVRIMPTY